MFAAKLERAIADERAGEQAGFAQHLEAVANAKHEPAVGGKLLHRSHHGTEPRNRAATQVIAITKSAWNNHGIDGPQRTFLVPDEPGGVAEELDGVDGILIAIGGGKLKD